MIEVPSDISRFIEKYSPCPEAVFWLLEYPSLHDAYVSLARPQWAVWFDYKVIGKYNTRLDLLTFAHSHNLISDYDFGYGKTFLSKYINDIEWGNIRRYCGNLGWDDLPERVQDTLFPVFDIKLVGYEYQFPEYLRKLHPWMQVKQILTNRGIFDE